MANGPKVWKAASSLSWRADRVGDLVAAVADVHVPERRGRVEVGLALVVPDRRAAALRDDDLASRRLGHIREPTPQLCHVSSFVTGDGEPTAAGTAPAAGDAVSVIDVRHPGGGVGGFLVERLGLEQRLGQRIELGALAAQQLEGARVRLVGQPPHLGIDRLLGQLRGLGDAGQQRPAARRRRALRPARWPGSCPSARPSGVRSP